MNKIIPISILFLFIALAPVLSQQENIGDEFFLNENVTLIQECDCSIVVFTTLKYENENAALVSNMLATKTNLTHFEFLVNGGNITRFGTYYVSGYGDLTNGDVMSFAYSFHVTKSNNPFSFNLTSTYGIILIALSTTIFVILFFTKNYIHCALMSFIFSLVTLYSGLHWIFPLSLVMLALGFLSR